MGNKQQGRLQETWSYVDRKWPLLVVRDWYGAKVKWWGPRRAQWGNGHSKFFFWHMVSLGSPGWPGTHHIVQALIHTWASHEEGHEDWVCWIPVMTKRGPWFLPPQASSLIWVGALTLLRSGFLFVFLLVFECVHGCFECMYICAPQVHLVPRRSEEDVGPSELQL